MHGGTDTRLSATPALTRNGTHFGPTGRQRSAYLVWSLSLPLTPRRPPRWPLSTHPIHWLSIISFNPLPNPLSSLGNRRRVSKNISLGHTAMNGRTRILVLTRTLVQPDPRSQAKGEEARLMGKNWQETLCNKTCQTHQGRILLMINHLNNTGTLLKLRTFYGH